MKRLQTSLVLAISMSLGLSASLAHAGKPGGSGGNGGGGNKGGMNHSSTSMSQSVSRSSTMNTFKPSNNVMKVQQLQTNNTLGSSKVGKLPTGNTGIVAKNTLDLNKGIKLSDLKPGNTGVVGPNKTGKPISLGDKSKGKISDVSKIGKLNDKIVDNNMPGKGKNGMPKDKGPLDKNGGKNKNDKCYDKYCDNFHYCYGFPWFYSYAYPFQSNYGYCGTVNYCDNYYSSTPIFPVTSAVAVQRIVEPVAQVAAKAIDLEVVEVRQIDRGSSEQGPAYRVVIRNASVLDVTQPFDVTVAGSMARQLTAETPHASTRVSGLRAGQMAVIEVRLPVTAMSMARNAEGQGLPFSWLTAVVDGRREVQDAELENNVQTLARTEVAMVE